MLLMLLLTINEGIKVSGALCTAPLIVKKLKGTLIVKKLKGALIVKKLKGTVTLQKLKGTLTVKKLKSTRIIVIPIHIKT